MDMLIDFIARHAPDAHWWVFFLLMLAGINLPISEDILIVMSAVLAATAIPGSPLKMFIFVFLGCYLSDWVSYGIGRNLIPRLKGKKWAGKLADNKQMLKVSAFYAKYGMITLLIGRFIPFGIRNFLFMSAGMGGVPFRKFLLVDGVACLASNTTLFYASYALADHYPLVLHYMHRVNISLLLIFTVSFASFFLYKLYRKQKLKKLKKD